MLVFIYTFTYLFKKLMRNFSRKCLCLASIILTPSSLLAADSQSWTITQFGAVGDGVTLNTTAIQKAVDACFQKGGGKVIVPTGRFLSGTIVLKDHVELHLKKEAVLLASTKHDDFPTWHPEYRSLKDINGFHTLIYAEKSNDISITGSGIIDGQGKLQRRRKGKQFVSDRDGRTRNILMVSCKKIRIQGVAINHSGVWNQHYLNCEDLLVDGITVYNHSRRNNDGIDIDGCRRVVVMNSTFDTSDDGICLKSTGLAGCYDVLVKNCTVSSHCNAIKTGTESTGGFRKIIFKDCIVKPSANKSVILGRKEGITGITIGCVDGGVCEDIMVNNIKIEGTLTPIFVRLGKRNRPYIKGAKVTKDSTMKNISIREITATQCGDWGCAILGLRNNPIQQITLSQINILFPGGGSKKDAERKVGERPGAYPQPTFWGKLPAYAFFIRNAQMNDIKTSTKKPDARVPYYFENIKGLKTDVTNLKQMIQKNVMQEPDHK